MCKEKVNVRVLHPDLLYSVGQYNVVSIDKCLAPIIRYLNKNDIETLYCCCGHGKEEGYVIINKGSINKAKKLGYKITKDYIKGYNCEVENGKLIETTPYTITFYKIMLPRCQKI